MNSKENICFKSRKNVQKKSFHIGLKIQFNPLAPAPFIAVYSQVPQTINFIQYNRAIHSYKRKFQLLHLRIDCLDQSDVILTF